MSTTTIPTLTLNNGVEMPAFGLGVFQSPPEETTNAVEATIASGYALVDTAAAYGNECEVGEAIRRRQPGQRAARARLSTHGAFAVGLSHDHPAPPSVACLPTEESQPVPEHDELELREIVQAEQSETNWSTTRQQNDQNQRPTPRD